MRTLWLLLAVIVVCNAGIFRMDESNVAKPRRRIMPDLVKPINQQKEVAHGDDIVPLKDIEDEYKKWSTVPEPTGSSVEVFEDWVEETPTQPLTPADISEIILTVHEHIFFLIASALLFATLSVVFASCIEYLFRY